MVVFCGIEFVQRRNLRHDGFLPQVSFVEFSDERFSDGSLSVVVIEDGGTVLCAHILTLLIQCRRVVDGEENLQDFPIGNLARIEGQLNCLGMAGVIGTDLLIGRFDGGAACVAGNYISTPSTSLKIASVHQKQPPARVATSAPALSVIACSLVRISAQCRLCNSVCRSVPGHHRKRDRDGHHT